YLLFSLTISIPPTTTLFPYTTLFRSTSIFKAKEHYDRLKNSAELINIPFNYEVQDLIDATYELLEKNNLNDAYVRPLVFCDPNIDRKSTRLNSSHVKISYAVFCLKKK